jgi:hypothetical protein
MLNRGDRIELVLETLGVTEIKLREALMATRPTDHEIKGFSLHMCPRPTPWELLEAQEE